MMKASWFKARDFKEPLGLAHGAPIATVNVALRGIVLGCLLGVAGNAGAAGNGVQTAWNTNESFNRGPLMRDSEIDDPVSSLLEDFYPAVTVTYTRHTNTRRELDALAEKDTALVISPTLRYAKDVGRHEIMLAYAGSFGRYNKLKTENYSQHVLEGEARLDLTRRFDLNVFGGGGRTYEERGASGSRELAPDEIIGVITGQDRDDRDRFDFRFYGADLVYGRGVNRLSGVLGADRRIVRFKNNRANRRDYDQNRIHGNLGYEIGEVTSIFGHVSYTDVNYLQDASSLDSEVTFLGGGLRWEPTSTLSGAVGIGRERRDFKDPDREDYTGLSYYGNLSYSLKPYSVLHLSLSRRTEETGELDSDYFISNLARLDWNHFLNARLSFGIYGQYIFDEYTSGREDKFNGFGANIEYTFRRWLKIGLRYNRIQRKSNDDLLDYTDEYYGLTLRSDLRLRGRSGEYEEQN